MSNSDILPTHVELREPDKLFIAWNDGTNREYTYREILDNCPCATCRETHGPAPKPPAPEPNSAASSMPLLNVIKSEEAQPRKLLELIPVGNYAYSFRFNHGCGQGIYTMEALQHLGTQVSE